MKEKAAVGADLYLEDTPENIQKLQAKKVDVIIFSNSTNRHVVGTRAESWDEIEPLVKERVAAWRQKKMHSEQLSNS